jgi:hypothetical protein
MKQITDFDLAADEALGPILERLKAHQQLAFLVLLQHLDSPVGRRWLKRRIKETGYIFDGVVDIPPQRFSIVTD